MNGPVEVVVAIPTFRRPDELALLLPMVRTQAAALDRTGDYRTRLLVVDNDTARSAAEVVRGCGGGADYVAEPKPGIAAARNRMIDEAQGARLLVMIDDDEYPHPDWLAALVRTWADTRAALVAGRVVAEFDGPLDPWIEAGDFFRRRTMATGTPISVAAAGNVLLDLEQLRSANLRFDTSLGLSGGEDTLLTRRMHRQGLSMVWCAESVIVDRVPAARATRRWVLRRAWSHGNASVVTHVALAEGQVDRGVVRVRSAGGGAVRIGFGLAQFGWGLASRSARSQARGLRAAMRGLGMISGAAGHHYQEYARAEESEHRVGVQGG